MLGIDLNMLLPVHCLHYLFKVINAFLEILLQLGVCECVRVKLHGITISESRGQIFVFKYVVVITFNIGIYRQSSIANNPIYYFLLKLNFDFLNFLGTHYTGCSQSLGT